jgi:hypothetical protein
VRDAAAVDGSVAAAGGPPARQPRPRAEVCELMDISESHQRVLLHRARVRQILESYLDRTPSRAE